MVALRLMATNLKNLAVELNAFVMSATQLSNEDDAKGFRDFRNIRGARSIVDVCDLACIRRRPTVEELKLVETVPTPYKPTAITDVFKNRRGKWNMLSIWQAIDLGTLTTVDLFVTTPDYKPIEDFQIINFIEKKTEEMIALENFYNTGEVVDEQVDMLLQNIEKSAALPRNLVEEVTEAFQDQERSLEKLRSIPIEDLI